jgi:chaperone required for assembly of F1-ATPase
MSNPADRPHRFYKTAALAPEAGGFAVTLDGRTAKTPAGGRLVVPSEALGLLLLAEWAGQRDKIDFNTMPATRLAFTAIDRTPGARAAMADEMARILASEHLCYFADYPAKLVERQAQLWGPWLDWAEQTLGLVLIRAKGISHQAQPADTLLRAKALALAEDDFALSSLTFAAGLYGSAVLAFAALGRALSAEAALDLARLDEAFQEEQWGVDAEAAARTTLMRGEAQMLEAWFAALDRPSA